MWCVCVCVCVCVCGRLDQRDELSPPFLMRVGGSRGNAVSYLGSPGPLDLWLCSLAAEKRGWQKTRDKGLRGNPFICASLHALPLQQPLQIAVCLKPTRFKCVRIQTCVWKAAVKSNLEDALDGPFTVDSLSQCWWEGTWLYGRDAKKREVLWVTDFLMYFSLSESFECTVYR